MIKSDSLYTLIKSMTKAEKRYFKLYSSINALSGDKDYVRLFDAIEAQDVYDEKAILNKFKNEPYFKQLKSVKFYLYRQIMKSLKNIHEDTKGNVILQHYSIEMDILYKKGLYKNCENIIKKAKAYAQKRENFPKLLEFLSWESKIAIWNHDVDQIETLKRKWRAEELDALKRYTEILELNELNHDIQSFITRKGYAKTNREMKFIENSLANEVLQKEKKTYVGEVNRLSIISNCLGALGRRQERYEALKKMIAIYDLYPQQGDFEVNFYNTCIVVNLALSIKELAYASSLMQKLKSVYETRYNEIGPKNKVTYLSVQSEFLIVQGEFKQAYYLLTDIDKLNENNNRNLDFNAELLLHEWKYCIYFCNQDFKSAQYHIREIINSTSGIRLDIQTSARIAYLIIQYEEKEYTHLEYAWRSTYRYLLKKERLNEGETMVLHFLRNAPRFNLEKEVLAALAEFKDLIRPHMDQFMVAFPLLEWIDSKIQNRELIEIVKEQYLNAVANEKEKV